MKSAASIPMFAMLVACSLLPIAASAKQPAGEGGDAQGAAVLRLSSYPHSFYPSQDLTQKFGTYTLSGDQIHIRNASPSISVATVLATGRNSVTAFVVVNGRALCLDANGNEEIAKQFREHSVLRDGDARIRLVDVDGKLDFRIPSTESGADPLARVPVVVVDRIRFHREWPGASQ